jgi:hypothetical protein
MTQFIFLERMIFIGNPEALEVSQTLSVLKKFVQSWDKFKLDLSSFEIFLEKASKEKIKSVKNNDLALKKNHLDSNLPIYFIKLNKNKDINNSCTDINEEER